MMKFTTTLLVIFAVLVFAAAPAGFAQTAVPLDDARVSRPNARSGRDLKQVIAENDRQYRERAENVDVKEMERLSRQTTTSRGLTTKQKTWIAVGVIGLAVLVVVLIKYGKECITTSTPGCIPGTDAGCSCTQYAQER